MKAMRRSAAAVLAFCLVVLSPGLPCYQALAVEIKAVTLETRPILAPVTAPSILPVLPTSLEQPSLTAPIVPAAAPSAPWTERLAKMGERFGEIIGLKGAGERSQGFSGFFDFGLQPSMALAGGGELRAPESARPQVMMMSADRGERSGWSGGAPPAPKAPLSMRQRLVENTRAAGAKLDRYTTLNAAMSLVAAAVAAGAGVRPVSALLLALVPLVTTIVSAAMRRAAQAKLADAGASKSFKTLFSGDKQAGRSVWVARLGALAPMDLGGMLAMRLMHSAPLAAAVLSAAVLTGWLVWRQAKAFGTAASLERADLYGTLKEGRPQTAIEDLPGKTALEKHGRYFSGGKEVAKFWTTYHYVRMQGLSVFKSLTTAASWHLFFSGKTQKNMTPEEKARFKPGKFDNYIPNFADAQGPSNTRIYAMTDIPGVAKKGDVDMREFERIFRDFVPGRDYVTMKDLGRVWQANAARDERQLNFLRRRVGKTAFFKRFNQLMIILGDRVVEEDGKLVPAVSRETLLRYYQGGAPYDLLRERSGS